MKIELTSENAAALAKYAVLAGCTPDAFLNQYLADHMPLFEDPRTSDIESHLGNLEYRTRANAERVAAWIGKWVAERSDGGTAYEAETCENKGVCWIEATTTADGLTYPVRIKGSVDNPD